MQLVNNHAMNGSECRSVYMVCVETQRKWSGLKWTFLIIEQIFKNKLCMDALPPESVAVVDSGAT